MPSAVQTLSREQGGAASSLIQRATPAYSNALQYWMSLMQGGPQAQQAVAPYVEQLRQLYEGTEQNIKNTLPAGGERNLALARLPMQRAGDISRLYTGMGPQAASSLGNLALGGYGAASGLSGPVFGYEGQREQARSQMLGGMFGGFGSLLGGWLGGR